MSAVFSWHPPDYNQAAAAALNAGVEYVAPVVEERTPRLEGDLRGSMVVHHASAGNMEAGITFHSIYARYQHEGVGFHHTEPGTTDHYLEGPMMEEQDAILAVIANTLKGAAR